MQLNITEKAKQELVAGGVGKDAYLRLEVIPGGCAGMSYSMLLDDQLNEGDQLIFQEQEFRVVTDPESVQYLDGLNIDYSDDLVESGFRLSNPNAQHSCGCGSSFSCG
ncbi:MAG: iron-sulfur cluster assembly accessory protein [Deltaproteobacteria bacterium]|nr:iron-sulfur cluster assembly accessory protein [Deltaproteobacteria bacterium]MBN2674178.1 iron-sulfur cluster assembly accessory protein [Deltaproteobacteria bacterium]